MLISILMYGRSYLKSSLPSYLVDMVLLGNLKH